MLLKMSLRRYATEPYCYRSRIDTVCDASRDMSDSGFQRKPEEDFYRGLCQDAKNVSTRVGRRRPRQDIIVSQGSQLHTSRFIYFTLLVIPIIGHERGSENPI